MRKLLSLLLFVAVSALADDRLDAALKTIDAHPPDTSGKLAHWRDDLWVVTSIWDEELEVAVLRETASGWEVVARNEPDEPVAAEPLHSFEVQLDLIPYRISPTETAFGVRVQNAYSSTARASASEGMHLYRMNGRKLTQIFAELTVDYNLDKEDGGERPGEERQTTRVVLFSKKKTKGFYDLVLRETKSKKTTTYRWDGAKYAAGSTTPPTP